MSAAVWPLLSYLISYVLSMAYGVLAVAAVWWLASLMQPGPVSSPWGRLFEWFRRRNGRRWQRRQGRMLR